MSREYWSAIITEIFDEHGIVTEQIEKIIDDISYAHDTYVSDMESDGLSQYNEIEKLRKELAIERNKIRCNDCKGSGEILSRGIFQHCYKCHGKGRL